MKEQFIQLGFEASAHSSHPELVSGSPEMLHRVQHDNRVEARAIFEARKGLTSPPESPHTDGREVILMEPRGENIAKPSIEARPAGQPRPLTPEQTATARTVSAATLQNELGIDQQRFQSPKDPTFIDRLKYWWHEFHIKREKEKMLKKKRTESEYVDEMVKFQKDVIGSLGLVHEEDTARQAGFKAIIKDAERDGYSAVSLWGQYFNRDEAKGNPEEPVVKNEETGSIEFKQDDPSPKQPIPMGENFPPGEVYNLIEQHNKNVEAKGFPYGTQQMLDLYNKLVEAKNKQLGSILDIGQKERAVEQFNTAQDALHKQIVEVHKNESEAAAARYDRGDYMSIGQVTKNTSEGPRPAKEEDVLLDRAVRDEVFNNLFANADSQTNEFFDRAWNVLSDGVMYESFMTDIRKASQGAIAPETLDKWIQLHTRTEGGTRGENESETDYRSRMKLLMQQELAGELRRYAKERNVRKSLHDANAIINLPRLEAEQVFNYIEQFGSDLQDYATRMSGVRQMMDIFETQTRLVMAENGGYLPPSAIQEGSHTETQTDSSGNPFPGSEVDRPEIEKRSKEVFERMLESGSIVLRDERTGEPLKVDEMKPWQIDRVYATARGMSMLSMRLLSISAESTLPPNGEFTSLFMQDVLQIYSPYIHLMAKYYVPSQKALAALLYQPGRRELADILSEGVPNEFTFLKDIVAKAPNLRLPFSREHMVEMYHAMAEGEANQVLQGEFGSAMELRKQNPMRCGDAFTYLSWRAGTEVKDLTASRDFLRKGAARMVKRKLGVEVSPEDLWQPKRNITYKSLEDETLHNNATEDDIIAINAYIRAHGGGGVTADNRAAILQLKEQIGEYGSWIGTGFRFERMRQDLEKSQSKNAKDKEKFDKAFPKAEKLLKRIVELQPHRIYLKSRSIQERVKMDSNFSNDDMQKIIENLSFLETNMYRMRETLLDQRYSFDGDAGNAFTLETIKGMLDQEGVALPNVDNGMWDKTREFMRLVQFDYERNRDKKGFYEDDPHGHGKKYNMASVGHLQEFISERDYHHGFILWSGDAPLEEFHFTDVGGTGGFIRRAGENKDVMVGAKATVDLITHLHDQYASPDTVYAKLNEIYAANKSYDVDQARKTVADLAEGVIKFFGEQSIARIPVFGEIAERMGYGSFAQVVYGKDVGAVWSTSDIDLLVTKLMKSHMGFSNEVMERLTKSVNATPWDHRVNIMQWIGMLALAGAAFYILKESLEDAVK